MSEHLGLTVIGHLNDRVRVFVADCRKRPKGCHYIDVRVGCHEAKGGYAQDSTAKEGDEDAELTVGICVRAGESMRAPGYLVYVPDSTDYTAPH